MPALSAVATHYKEMTVVAVDPSNDTDKVAVCLQLMFLIRCNNANEGIHVEASIIISIAGVEEVQADGSGAPFGKGTVPWNSRGKSNVLLRER